LTGVPKSTTSSRRRRFSGSAVLRKSTTMFCPCVRMSMPVLVSERSITMRPSPARPRRKSTSRMACWESARPSAKCATCAPGAVAVETGSESVTTTVLPSITASCTTGRRRLRTRRVRSVPCTTFMLRNSPWPMSWLARPSELIVFGKSNAMRAGLATAKLGGTLLSGSLVVMRTTTLPPCCETSNASMLFCAAARPARASQSRPPQNIWMAFLVFIVLPPTVGASLRARPIPLRCPAPAPSG